MYLDVNKEISLKAMSQGYVLVGINDKRDLLKINSNSFRMVTYKMDGQMVKTIMTELNGLEVYYAKFKDITKYHDVISQKVGGLITGNMTCWSKKHKSSGYDDLVLSTREKRDLIINKFKYKYKIKNKINSKITQYHHLHVRLKDLYCNKDSVILTGMEAYLAMLLDKYNDVEACHATFILYYRLLPNKERLLFESLLISYDTIKREWLKIEGTRAKQTQHGTEYDMSKLFELNVLENRVDEEVDWVKERYNREVPNTVTALYDKVFNLTVKLFHTAKQQGKRPMKSSWSDYWSQRAIAMPSGAVHSVYAEDNEVIAMLPRGAKNKKGFCSALDNFSQDKFLNRKAQITANVSTKYEWGKTRALYGCDITSHINSDFGLMGCEDTFPNFIPTGSAATPEQVKFEMKSMNGIPVCYDYDDFNSQHAVQSMQAVIEAWLFVYKDKLTAEQHQAVRWTRDSLNDMFVNNNITKELYKARGTLFSGWRLTSFMNTVLNYVYLDISDMENLMSKSIHNGDDVFASTLDLGSALKLVENAADINARAQTSKMNIGTIAEFLRMDIRAKEKTMTQYLTRGCATFVHSRIESDAPYSLRGIVNSYMTRYNELASRGASLKPLKQIYRKQLFFARRLFNVDKTIITALLEYDLAAGGLIKGGYVTNQKIVEYTIETKAEQIDEIKTLTRKGISDYTEYLKRKFNNIADAFSYNAVSNNAMMMYNVYKKSCTLENVDVNEIIVERNMKGAWSNLPGITTIHKLRMGISDIVMAIEYVSPELADVLKRSIDPLRWMRILL